MTKIESLLQMPVGQGTGGYTLSVKTFKKRYQVGDKWRQQCICADDTGEILVEVDLGSNKQLGREFHVIVGKVIEIDWMNKPRRSLMVYEYSEPTQIADDYMAEEEKVFQGQLDEIRGKIRHGLCCAYIQSGANPLDCKEVVNDIVEFIVTGQ